MSWLNKIQTNEFKRIQIFSMFSKTIPDIKDIKISQISDFISTIGNEATFSVLNTEYYNLFLFLICIHEKNDSLLILSTHDMNKLILNYISEFGHNVRKSFNKIFRKIFSDIKTLEDDLAFYTLVNKKNNDEIKSDCLLIFLNNSFLEIDPINIVDIENYYMIKLKFTLFTYLKNRTERLIKNKYKDDELFYTSTRLDFFASVIKNCQLKDASKNSLISQTIKENFEFKNFIPHNKKYNISPKLDHNSIDYIKEHYFTVYTLLRSININNGKTTLNEIERQKLNDDIEFSLSNVFKNKFNINVSKILSKKIANNISTHISSTDYIDPITMTSIKFDKNKFRVEFGNFLEWLFK